MDGFGFLLSLVCFVMLLFAFNKMSRLDTRIAQLKLVVGALTDELLKLRQPEALKPEAPKEAAPVATPAKPAKRSNWKSTPAPALKSEKIAEEPPPSAPQILTAPEPSKPAAFVRDMEQALASRWFVWIGGVAIAIGGLLFVKYAYDNGLISPALQIFLGLVLAAALMFMGDRLHRKAAPDDYVPAAVSAAGLSTAFASIYAAYALYGLVSPSTAFVGLGLVGLGALALSFRQGPLIAALGLLGSYATPTMISSPDPNGWSFFPYLLIIMAASFGVLRKRSWWWLGYAAIAGSALWSLLWLGGPFEAADTFPLGLFAIAFAAISIFGILGRDVLKAETGSLLNPVGMSHALRIGSVGVAAGALVLAAVVFRTAHAQDALTLFFLGMLMIAGLSWFKQGDTAAAPAAALLSLLVLMGWERASFIEWAMDERGFWTSMLGGDAVAYLRWMLRACVGFTAIGLVGVFMKRPPVAWAALAAGSALLFITGAWARVDSLISDRAWAFAGVGAAIVLLVVIWVRRNQLREHEDNLASGILAVGAAGLLVFTADRMLDGVWLTIAMAAIAAVYAYATRLLDVRLMGPVAAAIGSLTALRLFVSRELWEDDRTLPLGQHWPLYGYGIPIVLFYMAARWLKTTGHLRSAAALEGITLGLAISLISLEVRVLIGGGLTNDDPQLLEIATHILTWLGAAYGLIYRQQIFSSFISLWGARILIVISCAAILFLSLGALNPVVNEEPVPGTVVFNALLLAYLAPVFLLGLIASKLAALDWEKLRPAAGMLALVLAMAYVTLETKRVFQGRLMMASSLTEAESYAYSAVWLLSALALFIVGIRLGRQYIRYAGLGVMVLVVLKVFLWDMSGLEGLYQIGSFLGLGASLVGIGWLYQKFVQKPAAGIPA